MKIIEKKSNQITFTLEIEESLANTIRRYLNHIPILAVDEVEISKNDSPLYDEMVAHRIGLIPLKMDKSLTEKSKIELELKTKKEGYVNSEELTGKVKPVYEKIPITFLNKNQELDIKANAKMGRGVEHSKFSPGFMFYRNISEISLDKDLLEDVKNSCPDAEIKEKGDKIIIIDNKKREFADVCEGIAEKNKRKYELKESGEIMITLESFGQLAPEAIFKKAIEELKKDLNQVSKNISKL